MWIFSGSRKEGQAALRPRGIHAKQVLFPDVTENVQPFIHTADLGVHVGLTHTLD